MKKVAVFLRGNRRVWNYTKENIFSFCDGLAEQVDYYVAMWCVQKSYQIVNSMKDDFKDRNLRCFQLLNNHWEYNAWEGPAYLSSILNKEKINEELFSGVQYDAVLDTRPDVVFRKLPSYIEINYTIDKNTLYTVNPSPKEVEPGVFKLFLEDYFLVSDSETFDLMATRYTHPTVYSNTQISLGVAAEKKGITLKGINWIETSIVRPSLMDSGIPASKILTPEWGSTKRNGLEWASYTNEEKIRISQKHRIDLEDYKCSGSGEFKIS
jgi:hypothetical protein